MSTKFYINANAVNVKRTFNNKALVPTKFGSMRQEVKVIDFQNSSTGPQGRNDVEIDFSQTVENEIEKGWFIRFKMNTADDTNHLTLYNDCYSLFKFIELRLDDSKYTWKVEDEYQFRCLRGDALKEYGNKLSEKRAESDNVFNATTGVQITDSASQYFYVNLFDLFPVRHFRDASINGVVKKMRINVEFMPVPSSAQDACYIGASNTTANAYNSSVTFTNMEFFRVYNILTDPSMYARPNLSLVRFDMPYFEVYEKDMSMNSTSDSYSFNVRDHFKLPNFKKIISYVTVDASAYNSATAAKRYSGSRYLYWSIESVTGGSLKKKLDFTTASTDNERRLRAYEIAKHYEVYGNELPIAVHAGTSDYMTYFLPMTEIYFDEVAVSDVTHEVFSNYSSINTDYKITLQATSNGLGANCRLHIIAVTNEFYKFNNKLQIEKAEEIA